MNFFRINVRYLYVWLLSFCKFSITNCGSNMMDNPIFIFKIGSHDPMPGANCYSNSKKIIDANQHIHNSETMPET